VGAIVNLGFLGLSQSFKISTLIKGKTDVPYFYNMEKSNVIQINLIEIKQKQAALFLENLPQMICSLSGALLFE
jgi:hypothetical protein